MKEIVDRILNGDIEELTGEGFVFSILKDGDYIDIIPEAKEVVTSYSIMTKTYTEGHAGACWTAYGTCKRTGEPKEV